MKIAFIFPGQGVQYPSMGKDFFEEFSIARQTFEEANDILGRDIADIILNGPKELLTETKNSQVGIYIVSIAILRVINSLFPGIAPSVCAGLSLGEYTAATAAGYLSFQNGLPLVQHRGQYMNDACGSSSGSMAVVLGLSSEQVETLVNSLAMPNDLWAANFNCPGQVVISGTQKGLDSFASFAKEAGAKRVLPLQVHGAFHSGLMLPAQERLKDHVDQVVFEAPRSDLVMNVTGSVVNDSDKIKHNLIQQVTSPVRWEQGIHAIEQGGVELYLEMGPGKTLAGFNKRIGVKASTVSVEKVVEIKNLEEALACSNY